MIVRLMDYVAGTAVYLNPDFVVSLRPDPEAPTTSTRINLSDGESLRVHGEHGEVAAKLNQHRSQLAFSRI